MQVLCVCMLPRMWLECNTNSPFVAVICFRSILWHWLTHGHGEQISNNVGFIPPSRNTHFVCHTHRRTSKTRDKQTPTHTYIVTLLLIGIWKVLFLLHCEQKHAYIRYKALLINHTNASIYSLPGISIHILWGNTSGANMKLLRLVIINGNRISGRKKLA